MERYWGRLGHRAGRVLLELGPIALAAFLVFVSPVAARAMKGARPLDAGAFLLLAASALVLLAWRRLPLIAYTASLACTVLYLAIGHPTGPVVLAPLGGLVALAATTETAEWMPAAVFGAVVLAVAQGVGSTWSWGLVLFAVGWIVVAGALGAGVRIRRPSAS